MNTKIERKVIIDIETTGLNKSGILYLGHKIIEIGAIEIINRKLTGKNFHVYLNPGRKIETEAYRIHGISNEFLEGRPLFSEIYVNLIKYISNSEVIAHNANFDISFLNYEIQNIDSKLRNIEFYCKIIDTLEMARKIFPGKKNNLDALCKRYNIKNIERKKHSALLDAIILAKLYLRMTSTQKKIDLKNFENNMHKSVNKIKTLHTPTRVLKATKLEEEAHIKYIKNMDKKKCLWMT